MTPPEEFETVLKDVVTAKRLSASKMTVLTDIAMKNMEHDTQLVSILYRTHKSLSDSTAKVSSLYVFDALVRAAKHHASKHNLVGDAFTQPGNSASFIFKVGGVVESLFHDLITYGPETKEKTRKILDIWVKGNTFPSTILSQLSDVFKDAEKVPDSKPASTVDPRPPIQTQQLPADQNLTLDPQVTLLALLAQAASSSMNSISKTTSNAGPQLDPSGLAMIKQLAHTAASVPSASDSVIRSELVNVQSFPSSSGLNGSLRSTLSSGSLNEPLTNNREQSYSGYRSPEREFGLDPHYGNMRRYRSGFRHGSRVRGDRFQLQGRDARDHDREHRDQSPALSGKKTRSRSRSPPSRAGNRKAPRIYSPPRRSHINIPSPHSGPDPSINEPGKDEFGRDIRPESPKPLLEAIEKSPVASADIPNQIDSISQPTTTNLDDSDLISPLVSANTSSDSSIQNLLRNGHGLGMENFEIATFDYTSPASWEALGRMWQVTHGYLPTTEQLMHFVISSGTGQSNFGLASSDQNSNSRENGLGGGSVNYIGRNMPVKKLNEKTNAVDFGGCSVNETQYDFSTGDSSSNDVQVQGSGSGRMQKVGDKWVFVRGVPMDVL